MENVAYSLTLPRKRRRHDTCPVHGRNWTALDAEHSLLRNHQYGILDSAVAASSLHGHSDAVATVGVDLRKISADDVFIFRGSDSTPAAECPDSDLPSDEVEDSRRSPSAARDDLTEPDQATPSQKLQPEAVADNVQNRRSAVWGERMVSSIQRREWQQITKDEIDKLRTTKASLEADQPQSFLKSQGRYYHRQITLSIHNILQDRRSEVLAGRSLNAFGEPERTKAWICMMYVAGEQNPDTEPDAEFAFDVWALYRATFDVFNDHEPRLRYREFLQVFHDCAEVKVHVHETYGEVIIWPLGKRERPLPMEDLMEDWASRKRLKAKKRIKEAREDGDLPAKPLNEFQRKLMKDPILPLGLGVQSTWYRRLARQREGGRAGDYEPGFPGISMTKSERAIWMQLVRKELQAAGPAVNEQQSTAQSEPGNGEEVRDEASGDTQQQQKKKNKRKKKRKKNARAEVAEEEASSSEEGGGSAPAARREEDESIGEDVRHDSHQRSRDGSLAEMISGLVSRFKALR